MAKPYKIESVAEFKAALESNQIAIATKFIGINAAQATEVRKRLRDNAVQLKVFKNTLVKRALDEMGLGGAAVYMDGPTAWAFSKDPAAPAKVLKEFNKEVEKVSMSGGILEGKVVNAKQLTALADLPPREALLAQVVGVIAMPLRNLVGVLSAPTRNLVNALDQVRKQKEETAA